MVDVVSAVSAQGSAPRPASQDAGVLIQAESSQTAALDFVSSFIHMDNLQNVAILEYRSSRTGEVINQYPTQSQIDAFRHAALAADKPQQPRQEVSRPAPFHGDGETHAATTTHSAPAAPLVPAAPAPTGHSGGKATSILV